MRRREGLDKEGQPVPEVTSEEEEEVGYQGALPRSPYGEGPRVGLRKPRLPL